MTILSMIFGRKVSGEAKTKAFAATVENAGKARDRKEEIRKEINKIAKDMSRSGSPEQRTILLERLSDFVGGLQENDLEKAQMKNILGMLDVLRKSLKVDTSAMRKKVIDASPVSEAEKQHLQKPGRAIKKEKMPRVVAAALEPAGQRGKFFGENVSEQAAARTKGELLKALNDGVVLSSTEFEILTFTKAGRRGIKAVDEALKAFHAADEKDKISARTQLIEVCAAYQAQKIDYASPKYVAVEALQKALKKQEREENLDEYGFPRKVDSQPRRHRSYSEAYETGFLPS